jgi:uncharacterized coiled-coil protein SlyX
MIRIESLEARETESQTIIESLKDQHEESLTTIKSLKHQQCEIVNSVKPLEPENTTLDLFASLELQTQQYIDRIAELEVLSLLLTPRHN